MRRRTVVLLALTVSLLSAGAGASGVSASDFWDEVRTPGLRTYRRLMTEARDALRSGRAAFALERADLAIARVDTRAEGHVVRGRALGALARTADAYASLRRALELDRAALSGPEDGASGASIIAQQGDFALASEVIERALARSQGDASRRELYLLSGDVLMTLGPNRLRDATLAYRESFRLQRGSTRTRLGLALALRRGGEQVEAQDVARDLPRSRERVDAELNGAPLPATEIAARRAIALEAMGDIEGARQQWTAATQEGAWAPHARSELERLAARLQAPRVRPPIVPRLPIPPRRILRVDPAVPPTPPPAAPLRIQP